MFVLKLVLANALRHKLRTGLTLVGLIIATLAFGLLSTVVDAWYAGAEGASGARLVTRNAISLVFPLPITYRQKIRQIEGIRQVTLANWFGGIYKEPKNFFPQFAVEAQSYFGMHDEFVVANDELHAFMRDRRGAVVGRKLARTHGWKLGDAVTLKGTIYPGNWSFVVRAIYEGRAATTDTAVFFFHWDYLNETMRRSAPRRADQVGIFVLELSDPSRAAELSRAVDRQFANSSAETLTETEKAFQLGFVSMTETIVVAIRVVSFLVIAIIMAVMANTMAMTARERLPEYATLKALGFAPLFVASLVAAESLAIALAGGALGVALTFPVADAFASAVGTLFRVFHVSTATVWTQFACAAVIGIVAALLPATKAARVGIVEGLRKAG